MPRFSKCVWVADDNFHAILHYKWINKMLFIREFFCHKSIREGLEQELPHLKLLSKQSYT